MKNSDFPAHDQHAYRVLIIKCPPQNKFTYVISKQKGILYEWFMTMQ